MRAFANRADIHVHSEADWTRLTENQIDTIVDPMILRTAELFLAGQKGQTEQTYPVVWNGIAANIEELVRFFDLLVYQDKIPMIDYGYTFLPSEGFEVNRLYDICNDIRTGSVVAVEIGGGAYEAANAEALKALELRGPIDPLLRDDIAAEMTSFDYQWNPYLGPNLEATLLPGETSDRRALTFVFGGILFGAYAKRIGGAHLVPSKRARLEAAAAVGSPTARFENEDGLFAQLDSMVAQWPEFQQQPVRLPAFPAILPYLLDRFNPKNARDLIQGALRLRNEPGVVDLIGARMELVKAWREQGVIRDDMVRDLHRVGTMLCDRMTPLTPPDATPSLTAYFLKAVPVRPVWNWALSNVPGLNHIKLLYRMHAAALPRARTGDLYASLQHSLFRLWQAT